MAQEDEKIPQMSSLTIYLTLLRYLGMQFSEFSCRVKEMYQIEAFTFFKALLN